MQFVLYVIVEKNIKNVVVKNKYLLMCIICTVFVMERSIIYNIHIYYILTDYISQIAKFLP